MLLTVAVISPEFSQFAAGIFAANGIRAYVFPELRPTPELSYLIPVLGAISGVNLITFILLE